MLLQCRFKHEKTMSHATSKLMTPAMFHHHNPSTCSTLAAYQAKQGADSGSGSAIAARECVNTHTLWAHKSPCLDYMNHTCCDCCRGSALVAMDLGFMGPNYSISTACATANYCFVAAANHIRKGDADIILAGGSEAPIIPVGLGGFVACR